MKFPLVVTGLHPGRPSVSKSVSAHLQQPKTSFVWRANSPWCAQAAGRAPAPRPKLPKDAESKPIWSRSAWLPCRGMGARGAQVSRTPSLVLFSLDGMKKALERTNLCGAMVLRFPERDAITKSSSLGSKIHRCESAWKHYGTISRIKKVEDKTHVLIIRAKDAKK